MSFLFPRYRFVGNYELIDCPLKGSQDLGNRQTSFNLMGVGRFAWCLEILDCRGQDQSSTGGYNQTEKTIEVGEQRSLLSENAVKLALRPVCRLDCGISSMNEGAGDLLQPIAIDRAVGSQMLREDTLMKLARCAN